MTVFLNFPQIWFDEPQFQTNIKIKAYKCLKVYNFEFYGYTFLILRRSLQLIIYNNQQMLKPQNFNDISFNQKPSDSLSIETFSTEGRNSNATNLSEDDFSHSTPDKFYRADVFCSRPGVKKLGPKANRSAISWIQTNCWIKNFDLDTTVLSIILYYAYCSRSSIDKTKLELILSVSMFTAKKYLTRPPMELDVAMGMLSGNFSKEEFLELEFQISTILDFDFHFDHTVHLLPQKNLSEEQQYRCKFLIQILLLKDHQILFDPKLLEQVINMVKDLNEETIMQQLLELLSCKQSEVLINKYKSNIQIDKFIEKMKECSSARNESLKRNSV